MNRFQKGLSRAIAAAASLFTTVALAGPDFVEPPSDAGSFPSTAAPTTGSGPLRMIRGNLGTSIESPGDFEDMYIIRISQPENFCARTVLVTDHTDCCSSGNPVNPTASTNFNTQLFLFRLNQRGVLANDDESMSSTLSKLLPFSTDGTGINLMSPADVGVYFLAISGGPNRDPASASGQPIFFQMSTTEISGPDGAGGMQQIGSWIGSGATNVHYEISLCGCEFAPGIPTLNQWGMIALLTLTGGAGAAMILRKQHQLVALAA